MMLTSPETGRRILKDIAALNGGKITQNAIVDQTGEILVGKTVDSSHIPWYLFANDNQVNCICAYIDFTIIITKYL
jgi:hypothetical protein